LVTGILELANDYHREVGVAPLYVELQAAVRDGKILTFGGPFTADSIEKLRPLREKSGE
jgi:hypothetical protein